MKRLMRRKIAMMGVAALLPLLAAAGPRTDYASEWPLVLERADAGAYRVVLDEAVYRQVQSPRLRDLDVFDARGRNVPAALFEPTRPEVRPPAQVQLPWFPLPASDGGRTDNIAAISEIDNDGRLRRVELRASDRGEGGYLIDASGLSYPVRALRVAWSDQQAPFDHAWRVLASDDLRQWRIVQAEAHLIDLRNNGQRIVHDRIELDPAVRARYLRLQPLRRGAAGWRPVRVQAESAPAVTEATWSWQALKATPARDADGTMHYTFTLPGRFPVARADVRLPGNSTQGWRLESRDDVQAPWREAAPDWVAFSVRNGDRTDASPPQALHAINRDRQWRLTPRQPATSEAPELRLGYQPEVLMFIAQGEAPFTVAAGSVRAVRADAPLAELTAAIRASRGADWQPAAATLGSARTVSGEAALAPAPAERDWKTWLLWGLLVAGALLVVGFAFSLLRKPAP